VTVAAGLALLPPSADALGVVATKSESIDATRLDAIVWMDRGEETLVESIVVAPGALRFAVIRAFPAPPREIASIEPLLFDNLEHETRTLEPMHHGVRRRLFGPSILTPILAPLLDEEPLDPEPPKTTVRVPLGGPSFRQFTGVATTSTVTLERVLPSAFERWLQQSDLVLSKLQRDSVGRAFDKGWTVVATMVVRTESREPAIIGPVMYRFAAKSPVLPAFSSSGDRGPSLRLYALGPDPMVPTNHPVEWNRRPWARSDLIDAQFTITHYDDLSENGAVSLIRMIGEARPKHILRGETASRTPTPSETPLIVPVLQHRIPGTYGRGSAMDLFLCALLGLAPLLYAPESWLLLWIASRARAAKKKSTEPVGSVNALWPLYALVVAIFWILTLPYTARIAAIGPLAIGVWRLLFSDAERERGPIRIDFRRRKLKPSDARGDKQPAPKPQQEPSQQRPPPVILPVRPGGGPAAPLPIKMSLAKMVQTPAAPTARIMPQAKLGVTIPPPANPSQAPGSRAVAAATAAAAAAQAAAKSRPSKVPGPALTSVPATPAVAKTLTKPGGKKKPNVATPARSVMPIKPPKKPD